MMFSRPKKLIVVAGPTAVGKTAVAIQLARRLGTEIISADSRQFFTELTIGTSKPSAAELAMVKHHFVDHLSVKESYDAGKFGRDALSLIGCLFEHHDTVILCGGSGLYIKAVCEGFDDMPQVPEGIREQLVEEYNTRGIGWLQRQLGEADPDYYQQVDRDNPHRLMRALEVIRATGKPFTALRKQGKRSHTFSIIQLGLEMERQELPPRADFAQGQVGEPGPSDWDRGRGAAARALPRRCRAAGGGVVGSWVRFWRTSPIAT